MKIATLKQLHHTYKEPSVFGRYIHNDTLKHWLSQMPSILKKEQLGISVEGRKIISLSMGTGPTNILMWSQMHGNESTTTKAVIDLLNVLGAGTPFSISVLKRCTIKIIPILNPDGAKAYTRFNANKVDLNRDAQQLSQPESKILKALFDQFKPDYCFNLHDQRSIFGAGAHNKSATVSFLAPAADAELSVTPNRKKAMALIVAMNKYLQEQIPGQVGTYDDAYNNNCVGDAFQLIAPTILFEAGHFEQDYQRERTREFIFQSLVVALNQLITSEFSEEGFESYFEIPRNEKCFYDLIIRNTDQQDIAVQFEEQLVGHQIDFVPKISKIGKLDTVFGHRELQAHNQQVLSENQEMLKEGIAIVFVMLNNEKIALKPKFN